MSELGTSPYKMPDMYVVSMYVALQDAWYVRHLHVRRFKWTLKFAIVDVFVIGYCFYLFPNKC